MKAILTGTLALAMAACHQHDLGTGANTVEREYARPAGKVWNASMESAKDSGLEILSAKNDSLGGTLLARRANGEDVRIVVSPINEARSRVSVRVGPGDLALARLVHERIAENAGLGEARGGLFGGNSDAATYAMDLETCTMSARRTFQALKLEITREEVHATWSRIDARTGDSTPARIKCEADGKKTDVTFIAGESRNDDHRALVRRMKEEFETFVRSESD